MKPLLKWVGGKRKLAAQIVARMRPFSRYVEPFAGGAAVFWYLRGHVSNASWHLNDANPHLINLYTCIRDEPWAVDKALQDGGLDLNTPEEYTCIRHKWNKFRHLWSPSDQAACFLWLNATCFNGMYRENKAGNFNVPWGKRKAIHLPDRETLEVYSKALQGVYLTSYDAIRSMLQAGRARREGECWYLDPPYDQTFAGYTGKGFDEESQHATAAAAEGLAEAGAQVLVSMPDTALVRYLYSDWKCVELTPSNYSVRPHGTREPKKELLFLS